MTPTSVLYRTAQRRAPQRPVSLRKVLRAHTAGVHASLDRIATHYDLSDDGDVSRFCDWMRCGFQELERRILLAGAQRLHPDWRPSLPHLNGLRFNPCEEQSPESRGRGLGMLYVHTGSQLGASVMRKRYPALQAHAPELFDQSSYGWPSFVDVLDDEMPGLAMQTAAVESAKSAFRIFVEQHTLASLVHRRPKLPAGTED